MTYFAYFFIHALHILLNKNVVNISRSIHFKTQIYPFN